MSARDAMLHGIRRSLGVSGSDIERRAAVADRLARAPRGVIPGRGQGSPEQQLACFEKMARAALADVLMLSARDVPQAIADYLAGNNLPPRIKCGADGRLGAIEWQRCPMLAVDAGTASPGDLVTLSHAEAGIAETGTVLLLSGPENPTLLNFLPNVHIVVVAARDMVGDVESAMQRVRDIFGKGRMPRLVNLITGPSRSGDIEQTMYLGAHGPQRLLLLVINEDA